MLDLEEATILTKQDIVEAATELQQADGRSTVVREVVAPRCPLDC